jgi:hypothetical protein
MMILDTKTTINGDLSKLFLLNRKPGHEWPGYFTESHKSGSYSNPFKGFPKNSLVLQGKAMWQRAVLARRLKQCERSPLNIH